VEQSKDLVRRGGPGKDNHLYSIMELRSCGSVGPAGSLSLQKCKILTIVAITRGSSTKYKELSQETIVSADLHRLWLCFKLPNVNLIISLESAIYFFSNFFTHATAVTGTSISESRREHFPFPFLNLSCCCYSLSCG
jgi:hypothetical protein